MARCFDLIVFDWDGTLMDSAAAIVAAIQASCRDLDLPVPSDRAARHVIGLGLVDAMRSAVPQLKEADYPRMVERYRHHYLAGDQTLPLFPGIRELLDELVEAGHALAVATGKSRPGLERAMAHTGLSARFHGSRCADECFSKPHPQMLEELLAEFGVEPRRALMIGDTTHDLQMAANAGVPALGVSYGAHEASALTALTPLGCFDDVAALRQWLQTNG